MKKSIVEASKQEVKDNQPKTAPLFVKIAVWMLDAFSAVAILALATIGARTLVHSSIASEAKIGIAVLIVGLLASRLLERVFQARR